MTRQRKMRVALIQLDGKWPNLALMKLAGWHQGQGDEVYLGDHPKADKVYASAVFRCQLTRERMAMARQMYGDRLVLGGWGSGDLRTLPDEVEQSFPAYDLWPSWNCSMGFLTRGCIRRCPWCCVPEKEGTIHRVSTLAEFVDHSNVILLDNNLLAYAYHLDILEILQSVSKQGYRFNLNQGLDLRLVTERNAGLLARIAWRDWQFKTRMLAAAWDDPKDAGEVFRGLDLLAAAGWPRGSLMVYVLTNFNTHFEQDYERFAKLDEWGCDPFVMIYRDDRPASRRHRQFARWVNKRIYKACSWSEYRR